MNVRRVLSAIIAAGAVLAPASAWATTSINTEIKNGTAVSYTFNLDTGGVQSGAGNYANTISFQETIKDKSGDLFSLNVTASAWTASKVGTTSTYTVSDSYLGQWSGGGLGVINRNEGQGENNSHQIDNNINGTDFILLEFDRPVTLSSLTTLAYPMKATNSSSSSTLQIDNDVGIGSKMPVTSQTSVTTTVTKTEQINKTTNAVMKTTTSSSSAAPVTTSRETTTSADLKAVEAAAGTSTSSTGTASSNTSNGCVNYSNCKTKVTTTPTTVTTTNAPTVTSTDFTTKTQTNTANSNGTVSGKVVLAATQVPASKTWLVGAAFTNTDGKPDGFKLKSVQVSWSAVVPEPSTWAMMIVGFGFVGCAARRQRRIAAKA